jgi:hypothetical protein
MPALSAEATTQRYFSEDGFELADEGLISAPPSLH